MVTWAVLLRGINVGGNNKLPMAELKALLSGAGFQNPRTYIQSGNCTFESTEDNPRKIESTIKDAIASKFAYQVPIFALRQTELQAIIEQCPYDVPEDQAKTLHIFFLSKPAISADMDKLEALKTSTERYELTDSAFYLHTPDGIGRSKLAAGAEKCLGVPVTARNLRSANKILALTQSA